MAAAMVLFDKVTRSRQVRQRWRLLAIPIRMTVGLRYGPPVVVLPKN
jgi:hypothetical protein